MLSNIHLRELNARIDENTPSIFDCDPSRLRQILNSFLSNAFKFSPNSGKVELCVRCLNIRGNHDYIEFSVKDEGFYHPFFNNTT